MAVPVYKGKFTATHAERLLWRAGFGPKPGEAAKLAKRGLTAAVYSLTRPGAEQLVGPVKTLEAKLLRGKFRLWCSIANHRALGMSATLIVKK